jgi:hypothetical protein
MLCGISPAFAGLFPIKGQIAHVLRTRAPCAGLYCYRLRTRLACVKHAASVRSEPGSNSRLKPVAWRKKIARILLRTSLPSKIVSRSIKLNSLVLENPNEVEQILAHRIGCQRATASLSCRVATSNQVRIPNLQEKSTHGYGCFKDFLTKSRAAHVSPCCVVGCAEQ